MVYDKARYERNKKKHHEATNRWRNNNREKVNVRKRELRILNKERLAPRKKIENAKHYAKIKDDTIFKQNKSEYQKQYYQKIKEHHSKIMKKHRAKPEVKKRNAEYNKKYHEENPDKLLENNKKHLTKLGDYHNLKWYQLDKQLRGWSKIIHKDNNEICQVCQQPSEEAHHIFHKNKYPLLMFNRNNGIALCIKCHNQVHGKRLLESVIDPLNIIA